VASACIEGDGRLESLRSFLRCDLEISVAQIKKQAVSSLLFACTALIVLAIGFAIIGGPAALARNAVLRARHPCSCEDRHRQGILEHQQKKRRVLKTVLFLHFDTRNSQGFPVKKGCFCASNKVKSYLRNR
jgi:hypothetical protein